MRRRKKRRNRRKQDGLAWLLSGMMFLLLVCVILFGLRDTGKSDEEAGNVLEDEKPGAGAAPIPIPSYLEDIDSIDAGTVIDSAELDQQRISEYFTVNAINDDILKYINGKSYVENDNIQLEELRYLKLLHYNYDHEIQVGELIVNAKIAEDCREVFEELFAEEYEIESMYLIDKYWTGDSVDSDTNSIEHNNTSAFNYRVVPDTDRLSNHAAGFAIDINPLQNPYIKYNSDGSFAKYYKDMEKYIDRNQDAEHMITHDDVCFKIFEKHGFTWGGDWNSSKDYQHFEKPTD